ncbi:hypothetical protein FOMPIDRAFT_1053562 [Fomitopsis schrenkii]|uniref:Uncharacterized protein n=1 Tax=Fomitopsis schrenkii TaxID=2126942 RepID=S8FC46_FOMSC|nr:hypothetical protein FOMPIDRAFT_1053562 [Fomitopsis schrenkii]
MRPIYRCANSIQFVILVFRSDAKEATLAGRSGETPTSSSSTVTPPPPRRLSEDTVDTGAAAT